MPSNNRYLLFVCITVLFLTGLVWQPGQAYAQSESEIESIDITLWPEYEDPSILVEYEIRLAEDVDLPRDVTLPIPLGAELKKVSVQSSKGELLPIAWDVDDADGWQLVQLAAISKVIVIQYKDAGIDEIGSLRRFYFNWLADTTVNSFSLTVYQPYGASQLVISPSINRVEKLEDERSVYSKNFGRIASGEQLSIQIQYNKDIDNPNYPALDVSAVQPIDGSTQGRSAKPLSVVIWLIAVAGAVLIMVAIYYWWIKRRMLHKREHLVRGVGILNPEKQAVFCHECGNRSKAGDSYCRSCGTELRRF